MGARIGGGGDSVVHSPPADELFGREDIPLERTKCYPSQSAKSLLKDSFELNPPTHPVPSHSNRSFSADQMIQFARAVRLEVSLASYSVLEDLLMKVRVGSGGQPGTSHCTAGRSPFPSVAGLAMGDSIAYRLVYSLPTNYETEGTFVVVSKDVSEEQCSIGQADGRLGTGREGSEKPGINSLKTLQQVTYNGKKKKKKKSRMGKWSGEG